MSRPVLVRGPWRALVDVAGGMSALAACFGIHRVTLHRWITGTMTPAPYVRAAVDRWAAHYQLPSPWRQP